MAIDKALYQAPQGIDQIGTAEEEPLEITIEDPEAVDIKGPGFEISMEKSDVEDDFGRNLAEEMDESALIKLAGDL